MTEYKFPPAVSDLVQKQLASGQFLTEDEILLAALQSLKTGWPFVKHLSPLRQVIGECRCRMPLTKFENVTQLLARDDLSGSPATGGSGGFWTSHINMRLKMLRPLQQDGWNGFRRRFKLWSIIPNDVRWLPRMPGVAAFSDNTCSENVPTCFV